MSEQRTMSQTDDVKHQAPKAHSDQGAVRDNSPRYDNTVAELNQTATPVTSSTFGGGRSTPSTVHISADLTDHHGQAGFGRPWKTTLIRFGPLSGAFCMLVAIGSIIIALGILVGSNGAPVDHWTAPPATYLAICTAIANLSMRYAAMQGVVITWWYRASRPGGSTVKKLHHDWRSGSSIRGALTAGRNMGLLGLACIFSTVVVLDGPLLQRASTVRVAHFDGIAVPLNASIAPEIPRGFTKSEWATREAIGYTTGFSFAFNETVPAANGGTASNSVIPVPGPDVITLLGKAVADPSLAGIVQGCPGTCRSRLRAPALISTACTSQMIPVNYTTEYRVDTGSNRFLTAPPLTQEAFIVSIVLVVDESGNGSVNLVTAYADSKDCVNVLNMTACTLKPAVGEYEITISEGHIVLENGAYPTNVGFANNTVVGNDNSGTPGIHPSTLAGIISFAHGELDSFYALFHENGEEFYLASSLSPAEFARDNSVGPKGGCLSFQDPTIAVMQELNTLMVKAGALAASKDVLSWTSPEPEMDPGLSMHATLIGYQEGHHNVFHTTFIYFAAAALVEVICISFVLPTYWGWWKLGRPVSLSPLEIAKAFQSPTFAVCDSNSSGGDIAKAVNDTRLRYGVIETKTGERQLRFDDPVLVFDPQKGSRYRC